jgi:hypothetical protein
MNKAKKDFAGTLLYPREGFMTTPQRDYSVVLLAQLDYQLDCHLSHIT